MNKFFLKMPVIFGVISVSSALFAADLATPYTGNNKITQKANFSTIEQGKLYQAFIVSFSQSVRGNSKEIESLLTQVGNEIHTTIKPVRTLATGAMVVKTEDALNPTQAALLLNAFSRLSDVEFVEPDAHIKPYLIPNDAKYPLQWHYFESIGGVNLPLAWNLSNGSGVTVAVVDTGITNHPDLNGNILPGFDFIYPPDPSPFLDFVDPRDGDGPDPDPSDEGDWKLAGRDCQPPNDDTKPQGSPPVGIDILPSPIQFVPSSWHGTHVSGTIAALTNNQIGVSGVSFGAKIVPVRVLAKCGGRLSDLIQGIVWAAGQPVNVNGTVTTNAHPADIINLSLGFDVSGSCSQILQTAIDTARSNGAVVIAAAGNNSDLADFPPANCNGVISVGATDRQGNMAYYSNFGPKVDVSAPGGEGIGLNAVLSTGNSGSTIPSSPTYSYKAGTSMAAPHVSGVVALMLAANPALTASQVLTLLKQNARPLPGWCVVSCGAGIVDAAATLYAVTGQEIPDSYEEDDTASQWKAYTGTPQNHNFADDAVDWVASYHGVGTYVYETYNLGPNADTCIRVYSVDSQNNPSTLLGMDCDSGGAGRSRLTLNDPEGGYLIKITNESGVTGAGTEYTFRLRHIPPTPDSYEEDDTASQWKAYTGTPQNHNFADDAVDWVASYHGVGTYVYETYNLGPNADTCIRVYSVDSQNNPSTLLGMDCDSGGAGRSRLTLNDPEGGYLIKITNESGVTGAGTEYTFRLRSN